ncbi:hypothetical protein [Rudanella lutea]|uniref:hypothetical protein n=1 Tax=Rudanella lutea TaxID=451374 RepID=UPI0003725A84|nr:hypothetical protein [Rudanella lutea]
MKKLLPYSLLLGIMLLATACFKDLEITYDGPAQVEFETAVRNNPAVGLTFPLVASANSVTLAPTLTTQLNLVGPQRNSELRVKVLVEPTLTTTGANTYTLVNNGEVVIPANSSVGSLSIAVSRASSTTAPIRNLVLTLDSTSTEYKASANYKRIGFTIRN